MKKSSIILFFLICINQLMAQYATIKGVVTDEKDNAPMFGVSVRVKSSTIGAATDDNGAYTFGVESANFQIEASYVGYQMRTIDIVGLKKGETRIVNIKMTDVTKEMDIVVVTGPKTQKKFGEETITMEVLKGQNITQSNQTAAEAVNKVPGVNMLGRTISIRGGSGFADATSNRVMMLMNEIPMLSPENGSIRWDIMPVEAIDQMEITKGPASAIYGAQAMNGLVNIRTINPQKDEVKSKLYVSHGAYAPYKDPTWTWFWKKTKLGSKIPPFFGAMSYVWARRFKDVGIVYDGAYSNNQGYTAFNKNMITRHYLKLRYTPHQVEGLSIGADVNFFYQKFDDFFIYKNYHDTIPYFMKNYIVKSNGTLTYIPSFFADSIYREHLIANGYNFMSNDKKSYNAMNNVWIDTIMYGPTGDSLVLFPGEFATAKTLSFFVNPFINYIDKDENKHSLKTSYYYVRNHSTTGDSSNSYKISADYSYLKKFKKIDMDLTVGIFGAYRNVKSITFGNRYAANAAVFANLEKKFFKSLSINVGIRVEYNKLDTVAAKNEMALINSILKKDSAHRIYSPVKPLFRIGLNWKATEGTFVRASFGQGYRFPDIAEMFVFTPRSGAFATINPKLLPESGWSTEIGIKQGVKFSRWVFFADLSGYFSRYKDLIEFVMIPATQSPMPIPLKYRSGLVAQAQNFSEAQIWGIEISTIGTGKIFNVPLNFLIGYNYMNPQNLKPNPTDPTSKYLNYRVQHSAKADVQAEYKGFVMGFTAVVLSRIKRIDPYIAYLRQINSWYANAPAATYCLDVRAGYNHKDKWTTTVIVKNFTNNAYTFRPGFIEAPINFTVQFAYNFPKIFGKAKGKTEPEVIEEITIQKTNSKENIAPKQKKKKEKIDETLDM